MSNVVTLIVCIISTLIVVFMAAGMIWAYFSEKKAYNHGICPNCGAKLKCVATDSSGGRLYVCSNRYELEKDIICDYDTWVSYNIDN